MALQIIGKVEVIGQTVIIASKNGGNPFNKRELVLTCNRFDPYTGEIVSENHPQFEFSGKACDKLDGLNVGQVVTVSFTLQGSWYEKDGVRKNFTRVIGYDVEVKETKQAVTTQSPVADNMPPTPPMDRLPWE